MNFYKLVEEYILNPMTIGGEGEEYNFTVSFYESNQDFKVLAKYLDTFNVELVSPIVVGGEVKETSASKQFYIIDDYINEHLNFMKKPTIQNAIQILTNLGYVFSSDDKESVYLIR